MSAVSNNQAKRPSVKTNLPSNAGQLAKLARQIKEREDVIDHRKRLMIGEGIEALKEILLQGRDLALAKAVCAHGKWLPWLAANFPKSTDTAQRYMRLAANTDRVRHLLENPGGSAPSIRSALLACFPDEGEAGEGKEPKSWPPYLEAIHRFSKVFGYIGKHPLAEWPQEGKVKLQEELLPVAKELWPDRFA